MSGLILIFIGLSILVPLVLRRALTFRRPVWERPNSPSPAEIRAYLRRVRRGSSDWSLSWVGAVLTGIGLLILMTALVAR